MADVPLVVNIDTDRAVQIVKAHVIDKLAVAQLLIGRIEHGEPTLLVCGRCGTTLRNWTLNTDDINIGVSDIVNATLPHGCPT